MDDINQAFTSKNFSALSTYAHQFKGVGGNYGFDIITRHANDLEVALSNPSDEDNISHHINALNMTVQSIIRGGETAPCKNKLNSTG